MGIEINIEPKKDKEYTFYDGSWISDTDDEIKVTITKERFIKIKIEKEVKDKISGIIEDMEV